MKSATTFLPFSSRAKPTFGVTVEGRGISGKRAALGQNPARTLMEDTRRETLTFLSKCHQGGGGSGQFSTEVLNLRRVTTSVRLLFLVRLTKKKKNGSSSVETQKKERKKRTKVKKKTLRAAGGPESTTFN